MLTTRKAELRFHTDGAAPGDYIRFDSATGLTQTKGAEGFILHGGGNPANQIPEMRLRDFYRVEHGQMQNGLVTLSYALSDADEGSGGFACEYSSASQIHSPHS